MRKIPGLRRTSTINKAGERVDYWYGGTKGKNIVTPSGRVHKELIQQNKNEIWLNSVDPRDAINACNRIDEIVRSRSKSKQVLTTNGLMSMLNYNERDENGRYTSEARIKKMFQNAGLTVDEAAELSGINVDDLLNSSNWQGGIFRDPMTGAEYEYIHGYSGNVLRRR